MVTANAVKYIIKKTKYPNLTIRLFRSLAKFWLEICFIISLCFSWPVNYRLQGDLMWQVKDLTFESFPKFDIFLLT